MKKLELLFCLVVKKYRQNTYGVFTEEEREKLKIKPKVDKRMSKKAKTDSKGSDIKLVQFKLTEQAYDNLNRLREDTGSISLSEVIRDSLYLYQWAIEMKKNGYSVYCLSDDDDAKKYEVVMPFVSKSTTRRTENERR